MKHTSYVPGHFALYYWLWWLAFTVGSFLWYEIYSLLTKHSQNTLSNWIWYHLQIRTGESFTQWSAADVLTFLAYVSIFVFWLPWHFWGRMFT